MPVLDTINSFLQPTLSIKIAPIVFPTRLAKDGTAENQTASCMLKPAILRMVELYEVTAAGPLSAENVCMLQPINVAYNTSLVFSVLLIDCITPRQDACI